MSQSGMKRGKDNSEQIPLEKPVWFVVLPIEDGKIQEKAFNTTKAQKKALFEYLILNSCEKVYGVWNGQWNTNLFDMDINILKKRLAQELQMSITEVKEKERGKEINIERVKKSLDEGYTLTEIARIQGMSFVTLKKRLQEAGLKVGKVINEKE